MEPHKPRLEEIAKSGLLYPLAAGETIDAIKWAVAEIARLSPKWEPVENIHEEGMPYLLWNVNDPAEVGVVVFWGQYDEEEGWTHCMSVRRFFMHGYDEAMDAALYGEGED